MTSSPRWRLSRRARARQLSDRDAARLVDEERNFLHHLRGRRRDVRTLPSEISAAPLIFDEGISVCSEMIRVASCSDDISSEKKPNHGPPFLGTERAVGLLHRLRRPGRC